MKACTGPDAGSTRHLTRTEAVRIGAVALWEELQEVSQSYEGMAGAVVDALHHLGVLPLAEEPGQ